MVGELIIERRIEELRESARDALSQILERPKARIAAARIYLKLVDRWELSSVQAASLIGISVSEHRHWLNGDVGSLDILELEKIYYLIGIYQHLATLFSGHFDRVDRWLLRQNHGDLYGGKSPYDLLVGASPNVFLLVRQQLAAETV